MHKLQAYQLQDAGADTDANLKLDHLPTQGITGRRTDPGHLGYVRCEVVDQQPAKRELDDKPDAPSSARAAAGAGQRGEHRYLMTSVTNWGTTWLSQ